MKGIPVGMKTDAVGLLRDGNNVDIHNAKEMQK